MIPNRRRPRRRCQQARRLNDNPPPWVGNPKNFSIKVKRRYNNIRLAIYTREPWQLNRSYKHWWWSRVRLTWPPRFSSEQECRRWERLHSKETRQIWRHLRFRSSKETDQLRKQTQTRRRGCKWGRRATTRKVRHCTILTSILLHASNKRMIDTLSSSGMEWVPRMPLRIREMRWYETLNDKLIS